MNVRRWVRGLAAVLMVGSGVGVGVGAGLVTSAPAAGASGSCPTPDATHLTVSSNSDSGAGSLRDAMTQAQTGGGTICMSPGLGTITLASRINFQGTPGMTLSIVGNGVTIVGSADNNDGAVLYFVSPWSTVSRQCQIFGTSCPALEDVTVATTTFTEGQALDGGAVWTGRAVDLTLDHDTFTSNSSGPRNVGGAVDVADKGNLSVIDSSFLDNSDSCDSCGPDGGGAIISNGDPITVAGSTFAGNTTSGPGGAIDAGYGARCWSRTAHSPITPQPVGTTTWVGPSTPPGSSMWWPPPLWATARLRERPSGGMTPRWRHRS